MIPGLSGRSPEDLAKLPKKEAAPLLDALSSQYRRLALRHRSNPTRDQGAIEDVQWILCWVLRSGLERLCSIYASLEAEGDIVLWVGRGAKVGTKSIHCYVWRKLYKKAMKEKRRRAAETQADSPSGPNHDSNRALDVQRALASLTPEQREVIDWKANRRSPKALAKARQISLRQAQRDLKEATEAFDRALARFSVRR